MSCKMLFQMYVIHEPVFASRQTCEGPDMFKNALVPTLTIRKPQVMFLQCKLETCQSFKTYRGVSDVNQCVTEFEIILEMQLSSRMATSFFAVLHRINASKCGIYFRVLCFIFSASRDFLTYRKVLYTYFFSK
jgi:hypothetical protein